MIIINSYQKLDLSKLFYEIEIKINNDRQRNGHILAYKLPIDLIHPQDLIGLLSRDLDYFCQKSP